MAQDRTNMVSLLDIGTLMSGLTPKIVELGNGFSEITEDWGPDTSDTQYVNMKSKSSTVKGYGLSMTPEREFISDEVQTAINKIFKMFPTGADCETYYYRFYKTDLSESGEGKYLKTTAISKHRTVESVKTMQATCLFNHL